MKKKKYYLSIFAFLLFIFILCSSCTSPTNSKPIDPNDANGGTNTGDAYVKKVIDPDNNISDRIDTIQTNQ